jgi:periplasmic mercuric ion binding protein
MKKLIAIVAILLSILGIQNTYAQKNQTLKTETIKVLGNCETCKARIEKAAKLAGASTATWTADNQLLAFSYEDVKTTSLTIQKAIAAAGHDTPNFLSTQNAYNKLPGCCQYNRKPAAEALKDTLKATPKP